MQDVSMELVVENEVGRMNCPYCKSSQTSFNGTRKQRQNHRCGVCGKQYKEGGAIGGRSFPPEQIGDAIQMYYTGPSFRQVAKELKHRFGIHETDVSPETIRNWVDSYTDAAIKLFQYSIAHRGGMGWDFSKLTLHRERPWMMILDDKTGYIWAIHVHTLAESDRGWEVFDDAGRPDDMQNSETVHLMVNPNHDWRSTVGPEVVPSPRDEAEWVGDSVVEGIKCADNSSTIFTAPKAFDEYCAACVRFWRNVDTGKIRQRLAGWVITRNLFTKQRDLGGQTPGQAAGIKSPIASWADVVRLEARAFLPTVDPKAAVVTRLPSKDAC